MPYCFCALYLEGLPILKNGPAGDRQKTRTPLFVAIRITALLLALMQLTGCALMYRDLKPPTVELAGIQAGTVQSDLTLEVQARIRVTNPNAVSLPIEGGKLKVDLNGQSVAQTSLPGDVLLPANGSSDIDLKLHVNLVSALSVGLSALSSESGSVDWHLDGHVDIGTKYLGRIPVNETGTVQLGRP
jgi:LEA14-like dessication related protein